MSHRQADEITITEGFNEIQYAAVIRIICETSSAVLNKNEILKNHNEE